MDFVHVGNINESSKRPPKALLEKAVKAYQLYFGAAGVVGGRSEERLYARARRASAAVAKKAGVTGYGVTQVEEQIMAEAQRRGAIRPQPGKDY